MARRGAPNKHQWRPNSKHIAIHFSLCHVAIHNRTLNQRNTHHPTSTSFPTLPHIHVMHIKSYKIAIEQLFSLKNINVSNFWEWPTMRASKFNDNCFTLYYYYYAGYTIQSIQQH